MSSQYEYETYNIPDRDYYPGIEDEPEHDQTEPDDIEPEPQERRDNMNMNLNLTIVTDDQGRMVLDGADATEPHPGSVVLTEGEFGTAWQRFFTTGKWHRVGGGGGGKPWEFFLTKRNVVLVYDALERKS